LQTTEVIATKAETKRATNNRLKFDKVIATIKKLEQRIEERIPDSGIHNVCHALLQTASEAEKQVELLSRPNKWIRAGVFTSIISFIALLVFTLSAIDLEFAKPNLTELIQITEALINDVILIGAALFFLISLEKRTKTQSALKALHELRSMAHVIDMHQLTKDPAVLLASYRPTKNSPVRKMSAAELQRYLDYCSEMFSLIGKIAALYSERLPETEIVSAASDIEVLCTGLSQKVWQKVMMLK